MKVSYPRTYITEDIPLTVYESKAGKPYMNLKGWAEWKEPDMAKRDEQLKNIYLSAKMMKYHPLMTKEFRKSYRLIASAALRAMTSEYKYVVKKEFNKMRTALKAMRAAEISQGKVWTNQQKRILWEG